MKPSFPKFFSFPLASAASEIPAAFDGTDADESLNNKATFPYFMKGSVH